jgi:sialate O-acetylesterase
MIELTSENFICCGCGRIRPEKSNLRKPGLVFLAIASACFATVSLPALFSSDMLLQRDMPVPVWGSASPAEAVTVTFGGQTKTTTASSTGSWKVKLDPMPASTSPRELRVTGTNSIALQNVLVGEVWLCSGQSNMELRLGWESTNVYQDSTHDFPLIRQVDAKNSLPWRQCIEPYVGDFSVVAYFFGKDLFLSLGGQVPVGLILTASGSTSIERWTGSLNGDMYACCLAPYVGFGIRGVVWYQGESNTDNAPEYADLLTGLIREWRAAWGQDSLAFLIVQLPNFDQRQTAPIDPWGGIMEVREGQMLALAEPYTGLAITIDMAGSNPADLHPLEKWVAGARLVLWADHMVYGKRDFVYSGPIFRSMNVRGNKAYASFYHAGAGLKAQSGQLDGFAVCGSDSQFVWGTATPMGDSVEVYSSQISTPVAVRYSWASNPVGDLCNSAGLPASPFRSDGPRLPLGLFDEPPRDTTAAGENEPRRKLIGCQPLRLLQSAHRTTCAVAPEEATGIAVSDVTGRCIFQGRTDRKGRCVIPAGTFSPGVYAICAGNPGKPLLDRTNMVVLPRR